MKKIWIVVLALVVLIIPLWLIRFSIYHSGIPCAYKLDRWTGKVTFYAQYTEHDIEKEKPKYLGPLEKD